MQPGLKSPFFTDDESVCFTALAGKAMKFLRDVW
jgi:hypothetical protein